MKGGTLMRNSCLAWNNLRIFCTYFVILKANLILFRKNKKVGIDLEENGDDVLFLETDITKDIFPEKTVKLVN